jgi:hypothetical protein
MRACGWGLGRPWQYYGTWEDAATLDKLGVAVTPVRAGRPLLAAPPSGYNSPAALEVAFASLVAAYPAHAAVIDLTTTLGTPLTHNGRRLYALKIAANVAANADVPNYLVASGHHARELITPELALNTSASLLSLYVAGDAAARTIVEGAQTFVVWTANPDGLAHVWEVDDLWRKNRRNNGGSYGVDQNRNYNGAYTRMHRHPPSHPHPHPHMHIPVRLLCLSVCPFLFTCFCAVSV